MGVIRNIKIKRLTIEKVNIAIQEISNLIDISKNVDEKPMTEKEALQMLIYRFYKVHNIPPAMGPNENALQLFGSYIIELVNMEIPIIGDKQGVQLVISTIAINTLAKDWLQEIGWV